jgi:hypothetical protein
MYPTNPAAVAGQVLNLRNLADLERLPAQFCSLDAYVWPMGPAGVRFSAAECAELYGHLNAFYDYEDWGYKLDPAKGFVHVEWEQFRSWLCRTVQPADSPLRAAWAAINELLRGKLLPAAGILDDFFVACWRVVFRLDDPNPDHQDVEADLDLYGVGSRRCLLSCNDSGQQRTLPYLDGEELYKTYSNFLAMDGAGNMNRVVGGVSAWATLGAVLSDATAHSAPLASTPPRSRSSLPTWQPARGSARAREPTGERARGPAGRGAARARRRRRSGPTGTCGAACSTTTCLSRCRPTWSTCTSEAQAVRLRDCCRLSRGTSTYAVPCRPRHPLTRPRTLRPLGTLASTCRTRSTSLTPRASSSTWCDREPGL